MSIATKTGDHGQTGLMYNRRVPKSHPRVEAYGSVDELNAALGLARAATAHRPVSEGLPAIQQDLVVLMGELATLPEDLPRYLKDGYVQVTPQMTARLDALIQRLEGEGVTVRGWATPGATVASAALDLARTACRRAERRVCVLVEAGELGNPEILAYLNRLSDALWLLARWVEGQEGRQDGFALV